MAPAASARPRPQALAAAGANVVVGDLDVDLAKKSAETYDGLALPLDVSDQASFAEFLDGVVREHGRLDVLVNNAGFMVLGRVREVPLERQLSQLDVNLKGVILGAYEAAERMGTGGVIVNIASLAGRIPMPGSAVYSATKAGVLAFSEALDAELSSQGIRVGCVLPSFTNTELIAGTHATGLMKPIEPADVAAAVARMIDRPKATATVPKLFAFSGANWSLTSHRAKPWLRGKLGLDTVFTEYDPTERSAYVERNDG